jgi:hypothetical protein
MELKQNKLTVLQFQLRFTKPTAIYCTNFEATSHTHTHTHTKLPNNQHI